MKVYGLKASSGVGVMTMKNGEKWAVRVPNYLIKFEYIILQYLKFSYFINFCLYLFNINISKIF